MRRLAIDVKSEATFTGANQEYRTILKRTWNPALPILAFCMLNPSTAGIEFDDPTCAGGQTRARIWGFGAFWAVNLFDFRATDPRDMKRAPYPCSDENDAAISKALAASGMFICGWGNNGSHLGRADLVVVRLLHSEHKGKVHHLRLTKSGQPEHPLYIPLAIKPTRWL